MATPTLIQEAVQASNLGDLKIEFRAETAAEPTRGGHSVTASSCPSGSGF